MALFLFRIIGVKKEKRFGLVLSTTEKQFIERLANIEGLSQAALIRRLIRQAAKNSSLFQGDSQIATGRGAQNG